MTRAKPWRPAASPAAGNSAIRCVRSTALRVVAFPDAPAGALFSTISSGNGCGATLGSGVDAYIVSGIRAWAAVRSTWWRCCARSRRQRSPSACARTS